MVKLTATSENPIPRRHSSLPPNPIIINGEEE